MMEPIRTEHIQKSISGQTVQGRDRRLGFQGPNCKSQQSNTCTAEQRSKLRGPKELLIASKEFATENRTTSWWCLWSTVLVYAGLLAAAVSGLPWIVRISCSLACALVHIRLFVIYHDFQHGTILKSSPVAKFVMALYGLVSLNPPSVWNRSHDHHHTHNSKAFGANIGSYPILTTTDYQKLTRNERRAYGASRHPLTILLGYFTVFLWGMSIRPFLQSPLRHFDALVAIVVHCSLLVWMATYGFEVMFLGLLLPSLVASCVGAYLFYAQHNFPAAKLRRGESWSHVDAALDSSSFISMGATMNWMTGNIGFHHVHHLNARIPFYRLPEAMNALVELQSPGTTTLGWNNIRACLRLKLWDTNSGRLVGYCESTKS